MGKKKNVQDNSRKYNAVWDKNMGVGRKRKGGETAREIHMMDAGTRLEDASIHDKRKSKMGKNEDKSGKKSNQIRKKIGIRKQNQTRKEMPDGDKKKKRRGKIKIGRRKNSLKREGL